MAKRKPKISPLVKTMLQYRMALGIEPDDKRFTDQALTEITVKRLEQGLNSPTLETLTKYLKAVGLELSVRPSNDAQQFELKRQKTMVLTFFNHAGGVGKTSLTRDIAFCLSEMGFKVLAIDLDPQANLTSWLGVPRPIEDEQTVQGIFVSDGADVTLPSPIPVGRLDVIPSNLNLSKLDRTSMTGKFKRLGRLLRKAEGYDFILIDPNPSLTQLTMVALAAADLLVVPLPTNTKAQEALPGILEAFHWIREETNEALQIGAFVLTQFDQKTTIDRTVHQQIKEEVSAIAPVLGPLSEYAVYREAQAVQLPVPAYQPNHNAAEQLRVVTAQLLAALQANG